MSDLLFQGARGAGKSFMLKVLFAACRNMIAQSVTITDCPKEGMGACWVWNKSNDGRYGHAYLLGGRIKAHILSFIVHDVGERRKHHVIDHVCNVTLCVNPRHLRAVTQSQNMVRCFDEGRGASPFLRRES